jgi:two-component system, OmpR family, phosphate regulon sensor histidine kinase PhoR
MRSFFSHVLLRNWLFLFILLSTGVLTFWVVTVVENNFRVIVLSIYALFSLYLSFYFSHRIASSVTRQLKLLQEKTKAINTGEYDSALIMTNIQELAELSDEIDLMSSRLNKQFFDLSLEKEKFNLVLQSLKEGVFTIDQNKKLLFQNKSVPTSLISANSGLRDIQNAIQDEKLLQFLNEHIDENKEGKISLDVKRKYYSVRLYTLKPMGEVHLYIGVILDKTEDRERQMIREQFVQSASHELKTPITSIKGYTETLESKLRLPQGSNERRFLDAIKRNTDRMIRIIDDMLTISKLENVNTTLQKETFLLSEVVDRMKFTLEGILGPKNQEFITSIPDQLEMEADPILLEHLLLNLIQNASMYSTEGKSITLNVTKGADKVTLEIQDQGYGIPESELERIFERFYRVDTNRSREQGGTGLGLSIVKHITKLHSGWISVKSNVGQGSTFTINFPIDNKA